MNTVMEGSSNHSAEHSSAPKTHALVAYFLMIIGLFSAIPILLGAIWAMIKKKSARGTIYHSHYINATRTFWWSLFWTVIGCVLIPAGIGLLILAITWVWILYRLVRGLATITSDETYPL